MVKIADLHTHSTASDGQYTPAQLVRLAKERGLEALALTDHDTLDGLEEAVRTGRELGIQVLRGVELGAKENLHILGYGFSPDAPGLRKLCASMKEGRDQRKYRILDFLREKGLALTLEEVEEIAGGNIIGRPHFAQAMVKRGYVSSNREAFGRYLDTEEYGKIERQKPDMRTCVETLRGAGARVSLAHPYQLPEDELETLVCTLAGYGLDALECYYPRHTPEQQAYYLRLADKYHLHITGGSDFHGERVKPDISLAALSLELDWLTGN
ncbi:MAG: PHP domain-containing protein [Oscillospiraceae bacterium]|nr:PHP domain-containing protein [Oscillospiraceae bacterium]